MIAAKLANMPSHRPADKSANLQTSQPDAAAMLHVSTRSVVEANQRGGRGGYEDKACFHSLLSLFMAFTKARGQSMLFHSSNEVFRTSAGPGSVRRCAGPPRPLTQTKTGRWRGGWIDSPAPGLLKTRIEDQLLQGRYRADWRFPCLFRTPRAGQNLMP